jgi:hypothetical protein
MCHSLKQIGIFHSSVVILVASYATRTSKKLSLCESRVSGTQILHAPTVVTYNTREICVLNYMSRNKGVTMQGECLMHSNLYYAVPHSVYGAGVAQSV